METGEIIVLTAAILLGIFYGIPALTERRGALWKEMAEERDAALKEAHRELKTSEQRVKDLELRTDLTSLQRDITNIKQTIVETEERIVNSYDAHEVRAQERHEKILEAFEALTLGLKGYKRID
jgi:hypothetical protein